MLTHPETIRLALERAQSGHWLLQELQAHRDTLRHGQASLQRQVERLTEAYLAGVMGLAEYQRRRRDLEQRQQALAGQERQLEAQADRQSEITRLGLNVERFCQRVSQGLEQASWEQKRQLIEWLIARVVVTNGEVEIRYVIPTSPTGEADRFCHLRSHHRDRGQAHEQETTDALEPDDRAALPRRSDSRAERHARGRLPPSLSGLPLCQRRSNFISGRVISPRILHALIPIALCTGGSCRPFSPGPLRGPAYASLAEGTHAWEQRESSLRPFLAWLPNI